MIDDRMERLINRRLDGELTPDESLELDKLLIRSPEARALLEEYERTDALLEEYERTDALAAAALKNTLGRETIPDSRESAAARPEFGNRKSPIRVMLSGIGAVAAAILLAVGIGGVPSGWLRPAPHVDGPVAGHVWANGNGQVEAGPWGSTLNSLIEGPRHEGHRLVRDVFGVFDEETQSVYLLEMDRKQTTVVPVTMDY